MDRETKELRQRGGLPTSFGAGGSNFVEVDEVENTKRTQLFGTWVCLNMGYPKNNELMMMVPFQFPILGSRSHFQTISVEICSKAGFSSIH